MKSLVRPELPTASAGSSQATTAAVDNSAPSVIRLESTYKSGNVVQTSGATSIQEQIHWLEMIRDHIAANLGIEIDDFEYAPFNTEGGLGKVHQLFGAELPKVIEELNRELAA